MIITLKSRAERRAYNQQLAHRVVKLHHRYLRTLLDDFVETVGNVCHLGEELRNLKRKWWKSKCVKQEIDKMKAWQDRANEWGIAIVVLLMHVDYMSKDIVLFMEEDE